MSTNEELLQKCDHLLRYYKNTDEHTVATALRERLIKERDGWKLVRTEPTSNQLENAAFNLAGEFGAEFVAPLETFAKAFWTEMLYQNSKE